MLEFLKPLKEKNADTIAFFHADQEDTIQVRGQMYVNPGEPIGNSEMGYSYHIILVKDHTEDPEKFDHFDYFEAVLVCPLEYISGLIKEGWYGVIAKRTTTSNEYVDDVLDNIKKLL